MNTGGSVLCSNSSFSSLIPSPNTDSTQGTVTLPGESTPEEFQDGTDYSFISSSGPETTSVTFSNCRFSGDKYESARPLTIDEYPGTISIQSCSFTDFVTNGLGSAVYVYITTHFDHLCFKGDSSNFTSCSSTDLGGAIYLWIADDALMQKCRFEDCSTQTVPSVGGSIYLVGSYTENHNRGKQLDLVDCVFTDCSTASEGAGVYVTGYVSLSVITTKFEHCEIVSEYGFTFGGGICVSGDSALSVEGSQFIDCSSRHAGGAIFHWKAGKLSISDTLVQDCSSGTTGAMCFVPSGDSGLFSFLQVFFDGNTVGEDTTLFSSTFYFDENATKFPDVAIMCVMFSVIPTLAFDDCFTTIHPDSTGMIKRGTLLESNLYDPVKHFDLEFAKIGPLITAAPTARLNLETGKIELELKGQTPLISQEYEVSVEDSDGQTTRFRMLFKDRTGTLVPQSEDKLRYNTDYTITKIVGTPSSSSSSTMANDITLPQATWVFNLAESSSFLSFTTPEAPPILKASCRVGSGTHHAWIQLTGLNIAAGTYSVTVKNVAFSFQVTFSDQKDENGQKQSSEASVRLFGDGSMLTFDTEYTLESLTDSTLNDVDLCGMIITFSTPQATDRIVGIGTMDFTDTQKDEVSVSLSGADMLNAEYIIEISPSNLLNDDTISVAFTDQSGKVAGSVYSADGDPVHFTFGQTYEIVSITRTNSQPILFFDSLSFSVPSEPARIESTSSALNGPKTAVTVTLNGTALFSAAMTVKLTNPSNSREFKSSLSFVDETSCTVTFPAGQTETDAELVFGVSYDIVSIESSDGKLFVVNTGVKVSVPSAPIIDTISSSLSENSTHFEIVFGGTSLPSIGSFVASISPSISLSLSFENGKWTTGWLANGSNGMKMNTSYLVTKIADGDDEMILNKDTFTTPKPPPSLISATSNLITDEPKYAHVIIVFSEKVKGSFDIVVEEDGKDVTITVPILTEALAGESPKFIVVGDDRLLTHNTTYTIKSIVPTPGTDSPFVRMVDTITFRVPESLYVPPTDPDGPKSLSPQMKAMLCWLIPLVACLMLTIIVVIVIVLIRRRQKKNAQQAQKEMEVQEPLEVEKVDEVGVDCSNGVIRTDGDDHSAFDSAGEIRSNKETNQLTRSQFGEVMTCSGDFGMSTARLGETLYSVLHKEHREIGRRGIGVQIVNGLKHVVAHRPVSDVLTRLSSHWILLDTEGNVQLKLQMTSEEAEQEATQVQQQNPHPRLGGDNNQQTEITQDSQPVKSGTDGLRWRAPEVVAGGGIVVDRHKAAVFSLGLILWEIETGQVPFGELDAVNAQRQSGTGIVPKMDSLQNEEFVSLIHSCLSVDPKQRPTLSEIGEFLSSHPEDTRIASGLEMKEPEP
ncbi:hypothetical protein BLNAU_6647 [Blattamonas nauphoetae]|uniref:Protein kinase domain-containing protein n=1 Tax=Blattamonas nauphoetae TaxID=2049346 RepID=A0ABQ9Y3R2_9EUKA|nr:hypothetical protein BLNAU_6647 [Blattamonas nauphoetae]